MRELTDSAVHTDCEIQLRDMCDSYARTIEEEEYDLDQVYDIKYTIDGRGTFWSVRLLLAGGGPNVYLDTDDNTIRGFWGCDKVIRHFSIEAAEYINDHFEEMYKCLS